MALQEVTLTPKEQKNRKFSAVLSLSISTILMVIKFWAYNFTNSQAVFSDALESIVNVAAAGLALFVVYYATKPKDQDHPYGHGKVEYFSATFEGGLITFAGFFIVVEAARAFISGQTVTNLSSGILVVLGAGFANLALGLFLIQQGKKHGSIALRASGKHVISDFWTSVGISVGLGLALALQMLWLDSAIAAFVGVLLLVTGLKLVRESIGGLMDEENLEVMESLREVLNEKSGDGVIQVHNVRVIRSGWYHHVDAHLVVPEFWRVDLLHDRLLKFEKEVMTSYEYGGEMNFHVDPCRRAYCRHCDLKECPVRQEAYEKSLPMTLENLRSEEEPEEFRE